MDKANYEKTGESRVMKVTKKLAREFMEMKPCRYDRPLRKQKLNKYRQDYEAGRFTGCLVWVRAFCVATGETVRINGKHTSTLFSSIEGPLRKDLSVVIEDYRCPTEKDVADLYATCDNKLSSRSTTDVNMSYAATSEELNGIGKEVIGHCTTALNYKKRIDQGLLGLGRYGTDPRERALLLVTEEGIQFTVWVSELFSRGGHKHIKRDPVVSAMYITWLRSREDATKFWEFVRGHGGPGDRYSPAKNLAIWLTEHKLGRDSKSEDDFVSMCIQAWNDFRKGRTIRSTYRKYKNGELPEAI